MVCWCDICPLRDPIKYRIPICRPLHFDFFLCMTIAPCVYILNGVLFWHFKHKTVLLVHAKDTIFSHLFVMRSKQYALSGHGRVPNPAYKKLTKNVV